MRYYYVELRLPVFLRTIFKIHLVLCPRRPPPTHLFHWLALQSDICIQKKDMLFSFISTVLSSLTPQWVKKPLMTLPTDTRGLAFLVFWQIQVQLFKQYYAIVNLKKISTIAFISYFGEACLTDDLMETPSYPNKPPQKKSSIPFGSKTGTLTTLNLMLEHLLYA